MPSSLYLDVLDDLLHPGIAGLSERFVDTQVRFVAGCQQPDGGFGGRQGRSDAYYTDFALRTLAWLAPEHAGFDRAAGYLAHLPCRPRDTVECFNVLSARRLLERRSVGFDPLLPAEWLRRCLLPQGGFARSADDRRVSAYHTFLGALCCQMLGVVVPAVDDAIDAIERLRRPDGGYADLAGQTASQTSATAAAVAFLMMHDALPPKQAAGTSQFVAHMQSGDGGLKAHSALRDGDLLSTFTGLVTLCALDGLHQIDAAGVARFLRSAAHPGGGFLSSAGDDLPDVEYTHYGVGALALLHRLTPAGA